MVSRPELSGYLPKNGPIFRFDSVVRVPPSHGAVAPLFDLLDWQRVGRLSYSETLKR